MKTHATHRHRLLSCAVLAASLSLMVGACFSAGQPGGESGDAASGSDAGDDTVACRSKCDIPDSAQHVVADCSSDTCSTRCESGWFDQDGDDSNGCETKCTDDRKKTWYRDQDGDGFGTSDETETSCAQPDGYVGEKGDCDDSDASAKPREVYPDQDGDGFTLEQTETVCTGEAAPSGYKSSKSEKTDCDDSEEDVHPEAAEVCDGADTNCDGIVDNVDPDGSAGKQWFVDCDDDGWAPTASGSMRSCDKPPRSELSDSCNSSVADWTDKAPESISETDCNDNNPDAYPGQKEWQTDPMNADSVLEKWDYDCDDTVEKQYTEYSACASDSDNKECHLDQIQFGNLRSVDGGGWVNESDKDLPCGSSAEYHACQRSECCVNANCVPCAQCASNTETRTQGCL